MNEKEILWKLALPNFPNKSRNKILNNFSNSEAKKSLIWSAVLWHKILTDFVNLFIASVHSGLPGAGRAVAVYFAESNKEGFRTFKLESK